MNEAQTKHDLITPALHKAGWGVVEGSRLRLEFPITKGRLIGQGKRKTPLFADYVLEYRNRQIGIVEAKKRDNFYTDGLGQAKDYAERLNIRFTYATNGLQIYEVDMEEGVEGDIPQFPTPDELWERTFPTPKEDYKVEIADWKERLFAIPFEDRSGTWQPRYYQINAITKVIEAIANKKDRILLTLATGTGKTAIAFQIAWKLFHAKWNLRRDGQRRPRILFLADRNILADQAFNSFNAFDVIDENIKVRINPAEIKKNKKVPTNGSVFFTIFQTFMTSAQNLAEPETKDEAFSLAAEQEIEYDTRSFNFGQYPPDFFDLIIIDECHRGGANDESTWRGILEYFSPAVQLGLTATPKRDVNKDTYAYFGDPVYIYSLKEGINDGFLTPFKVKEITSTIDNYTYTGDDDIESDEPIEIGTKYSEDQINKIIEIKAREEYRVKLFLEMINQNQKTLVFCATQIHAAAVRDLINQHADSTNINYCHRVTADDGGIGENHLRDFQNNEKSIPTILTTSRKLSTGVDAPEVRNIVLMRPIKSMVEFKQIVGRGTRLYDGKDYFTIYDFVNAHEHFNDDSWDGPPLPPDPPIEGPGTGPKPPCSVCGQNPCVCEKPPEEPCPVCGNIPCTCETPPRKIIKVTLSDEKVREIDSMVKTSFWSPTGTPISAAEFIQQLFGDLPGFFKSEDELRKLWSLPSTRKKLLLELEERGYTYPQLEDLRKLVHGEDSDLFDVLGYVAYHKDLVPRLERAEKARVHFGDYNPKQQEFLNFVLEQYVKEGVEELDEDKLPDLIELKYKAITDAKRELGDVKSIRDIFIGFQEHLYQGRAV